MQFEQPQLGFEVDGGKGGGERVGRLRPDVRDVSQLRGGGPAGGGRGPEPLQQRGGQPRPEPGDQRQGKVIQHVRRERGGHRRPGLPGVGDRKGNNGVRAG